MGITLKILGERVFKAGYILRHELVENPEDGAPPIEWTMAYTPRGEYIGDVKIARSLAKRGISPELSNPEHSVCSVGFSFTEGLWYGWSHRAIFGFKIGSECRKGDCHYVPRNEGGRGFWRAKTIANAREMAILFAESVS